MLTGRGKFHFFIRTEQLGWKDKTGEDNRRLNRESRLSAPFQLDRIVAKNVSGIIKISELSGCRVRARWLRTAYNTFTRGQGKRLCQIRTVLRET